MKAKKDKKVALSSEIIRFVVVGLIATVVDLLLNYLFVFIIPNTWNSDLKIIICTTAGFIGGVIVNYILSVLWVFQNVENKKESKSKKNFFMFVLLSAIGLVLGIAFMSGFNAISISSWNIDLYAWEPENFSNIFADLGTILSSIGFWLFTIFFCIKTLIVLFYNYISRKVFIFKSPDKKSGHVDGNNN